MSLKWYGMGWDGMSECECECECFRLHHRDICFEIEHRVAQFVYGEHIAR